MGSSVVGACGGLVDAVADVRAAIDRLVACEPAGASTDAVVALERERARLGAAAAAILHGWDAGGRWRASKSLSAANALAAATGTCHRARRVELRRAAKLAAMPHTRSAILDGRLSLDHLDLFARYATARRWAHFCADEELLVGQCGELAVFADCRRLVAYWAAHVDALVDAAPHDPDPSRLYASRSEITGELVVHGVFTPIDSEIVDNELFRLTRVLEHADRACGRVRTRAERRAGALVLMATRSTGADGATARPLFQVLVGPDTVAHLCELASGTVVHPDQLAGHLDQALIESFLFDEHHTILGASPTRTFTGRLRRAIQARDRRCQHDSGCPTPAHHGDIDHIIAWAHGGDTSQFNGRADCIPHNRTPELADNPTPRPPVEITQHDHAIARFRWQLDQPPDPLDRWRILRWNYNDLS